MANQQNRRAKHIDRHYRLSPEQLDRFIHIQIRDCAQQEDADKVKAARIITGNHPVMLTQRQQEFLGKSLTTGDYAFNHNLVKVVIDTLRERLNVAGFTVNGVSAEDRRRRRGQVSSAAVGMAEAQRVAEPTNQVLTGALYATAKVVMVDYDNHAR